MAQKLDYPKSESELKVIQDKLYQLSSESKKNPIGFKGLLEIMSCETTIMTAIHNIKSNKGSNTPGVDGKTIEYFLQKDYQEVIDELQSNFRNYTPDLVRRKNIEKESGGTRPLGIPTIKDRIIQECMRIVIEPIAEGKFFDHSYGFRPMRDQKHALARVQSIIYSTDCHYAVEGDIKGFFDNVNHTVLLKQLYHIGIRDRRVLMIIKSMLKAKIMEDEFIFDNDKGTPQGGILSPLLANIYLNKFDRWITREWEANKQHEGKSTSNSAYRTMKKHKMKPMHLIRYADDWIILTNSKRNAEIIKHRAGEFLKNQLKIELSMEKTKITNVKQSRITFLGFDIKIAKVVNTDKGRKAIQKITPNKERVEKKLQELKKDAFKLRMCDTQEVLAERVLKFNAKVRGIVNYYDAADSVQRTFKKHYWRLNKVIYHSIKKYNERLIPAKETHNLISVHSDYSTKIPFIEIDDVRIGVTSLAFVTFKPPAVKNPLETPFTEKGRKLNIDRKNKRPLKVRADNFVKPETIAKAVKQNRKMYNYEFFMNRAYAYNRDRGKCRVCSEPVYTANFHHIKPYLLINEVNKVVNIATVHDTCHRKIHDDNDYSNLPEKTWKKIQKFRKSLSKKDEITVNRN
ncbi:group II intron reverse transcriptase/maturase [Metabacillus endolithicus]|uniref:Group II intron reverse transcriptase/maturase n=1 Tax=Metabacillus endolithicus TaxID=1535204 RepID=A0ABW5BRT5_9BACI